MVVFMVLDFCACRFNGFPNAVISATAADIAMHRIADFLVRWMRVLFEQCRGSHDLPGLAIATLRLYRARPGKLHRVIAFSDKPSMVVIAAACIAETGKERERMATPFRCTVHARIAQYHSHIFCARELKLIPEHP